MYIRPTQPETPRLHNYQPLVDTTHNWDLHFTIIGHKTAHYNTSELYAPPFTLPCAKWLLTHLPLWLRSFTPRGPGPCPHPLGIAHDVHAVYVRILYIHSRTGAQTCGCPLDSMYSTPYAKDNYEAILCLLFDKRVHKNSTEPAQVRMRCCATDQHHC